MFERLSNTESQVELSTQSQVKSHISQTSQSKTSLYFTNYQGPQRTPVFMWVLAIDDRHIES